MGAPEVIEERRPATLRSQTERRVTRLLSGARHRAGPSLVLAAPAVGTVVLSFESGGYFAGTVGAAAAVGLVVLAARGALARRPFAGLGPWALAAATALGAFGAWTLASAMWSDAPARAIVEADRVLLYLAVLVLAASVPRTRATPGALAGWLAAAMVVVCGAALVSRTLPDLLRVAPNVIDGRLSYPLTYWNALGLMAAVATVLCFHVAADARHAAARALGAAAVPVAAAALVLTFSRASIIVAAVALVAYGLLGRSRGLVGAALATAPAAAVSIHAAVGADLLAETSYTTTAAMAQGAHVARVVAVAALLAALARLGLSRLDDGVAHLMRRQSYRRAAWSVTAAAGLAAVAAALAVGAPAAVKERIDEFRANERVIEPGQPLRERLTSASSHDRVLMWDASLEAFRSHPARGSGAGTYALVWHERRPEPEAGQRVITVNDAHSLYLEVVGELGLPGLLLLLAALAVPVVALARLVRGPQRAAWAALLVAVCAWAVHAGADWDWEMPAVTLFVFAAGGAAVARGGRDDDSAASRAATPVWLRVPAVALCALAAVVPMQMWRSQLHLDRGVKALIAGDCSTAIHEARSARAALAVRPEPSEVLGICQARLGEHRASVRTLESAVRRDPRNWELHYELALVRGMAGLDPRSASERALQLNPQEPLTALAARRFDTTRADVWRRRALSAPLPGLAPPPGPGDGALPSAGGSAAAPPGPAAPRPG